MKQHKPSEESGQEEKRKSLSGWFLSKEEPDKDYIPDLKSQWERLENMERVKFILGAVLGVILFFGALFLVYLLLGAMIG